MLDEAQSVLEDARASTPATSRGALCPPRRDRPSADSDVARARALADEALDVLPEDELYGLHDARSLLATIAWWVGGATRSDGRTMRRSSSPARWDDATSSLALTQLAGVASVSGDLEEALR